MKTQFMWQKRVGSVDSENRHRRSGVRRMCGLVAVGTVMCAISGLAAVRVIDVDTTLSADTDWSGDDVTINATLNLNGYKLVLKDLQGSGKIVDWQVVDYIEAPASSSFSRAPYVKAGYTLLKDDVVDARMVVSSTHLHITSSLFGSCGDGNYRWYVSAFSGGGKTYYYKRSSAQTTGNKKEFYDQIIDIHCDKANLSWKPKGATAWTETLTQSSYGDADRGFYIFGQNDADGNYYASAGKLYSFKVTSGGTVVRDFVPAKKNSGAYGLIDRANGYTWYGPAQGAFSGAAPSRTSAGLWLAADVVNPTLTIDATCKVDLRGHNLTLNRFPVAGEITDSNGRDYELLDYIESTGGPYINAGYTLRQDDVVDARMVVSMKALGNSTRILFGSCGDGGYRWYVGSYVERKYCYKRSSTQTYGSNAAFYDQIIDIHCDRTDLSWKPKDATAWTQTLKQTTYTDADRSFYIFDENDADTGRYPTAGKLYSFKVTSGGAVVRDFVPARRISDGAVGVIDLAHLGTDNEFYASVNGSFVAGVVTNAFLSGSTCGTLHIAIGSGTVNNSTVALSGGLKVVKEGAGTFTSSKAQTYTGGTEVSAGTFQCGTDGHCFGANGTVCTIRTGATLDFNGKPDQSYHPLVLDGGTLSCTTGNSNDSAWVSDVTLTKDSFLKGQSFGLSGTAARLEMNDHTLTIEIASGKQIYLSNLTVTGGGCIFAKTGGWLLLGGTNTKTGYLHAPGTRLEVLGASISEKTTAADPATFLDYLSGYTASSGYDATVNNGGIVVTGQFKPGTYWHTAKLADGATLDLSNQTGAWSTNCYFSASKVYGEVSFADNATIWVDLGNRRVPGRSPVVSWENQAPSNLSGLTFNLKPGRNKGRIIVNSRGIFYLDGFLIKVR